MAAKITSFRCFDFCYALLSFDLEDSLSLWRPRVKVFFGLLCNVYSYLTNKQVINQLQLFVYLGNCHTP